MKKNIYNICALLFALPLLIGFSSCNESNVSDLRLDGDTFINALSLDSYEAEIDNVAKTAKVSVPFDFDASNMKVSAINLSQGAIADLAVGEVVDCTVPRSIRVTNGDVFTDYLLTIVHDNVMFTSFTIDSKYQGTIDNDARTIQVFVPIDADVTSMLVSFTVNEGASVTPASSSIVDFTNPVEFVATYRTAVITYTVTVTKDDMSQEPKAFIGNAASVDELGNEAHEAAVWMMANVPNSVYVSLQDVLNGTVKLGDFKMIWCHFDWLDWPGIMWDTRDLFNDYYIKGGCILASRDGARYINDVWRIALDQQSPNNMYGGDSADTLDSDLGFCVAGHENHEIFAGLPISDNRVLMVSAGCSNSNRYIWGWCGTRPGSDNTASYDWAGNLVAHKVIQHEDGSLTLGEVEAVANKYSKGETVKAVATEGNASVDGSNVTLNGEASAIFGRLGKHTRISFTVKCSNEWDKFGVSFARGSDSNSWYSLIVNPEWENGRKINFEQEGPAGSGFLANNDGYVFSRPADNVYNVTIVIDNSVCVVYVNSVANYTCRIYGISQNCWSINSYGGNIAIENLTISSY